MVKLRVIPRAAAFVWSPGVSSTFLATGTRAGAIDADFLNVTRLELWDLDLNDERQSHELESVANIDTDSRFYDIDWVQRNDGSGKGIIAAALENGSLDLWDAQKLLDGKRGESLISRASKHSGPIKALQFNPFRSELLATVGNKGELFVSDLNNIDNPFRLGSSISRAGDFECLDWNQVVPHIMVTGSNTGFVTVWDVKTKKESLTLNNLGRKAVSAIVWDPDKSTRLITAVPNDTDPLILVWDLRNSNAPERVLRGHDGGILSLAWCHQDNDLLLSCGKDNRSICWNPQTGDSYGEFSVVTNWTFQTRWNPRNPNIIATASFDGKIEVQSIQTTLSEADVKSERRKQLTDDKDFFNMAQVHPHDSSFILPNAPKWMKRPCGAAFGFGGKILSFNLSRKTGTLARSTVRVSQFIIDNEVSAHTEAFEKALVLEDLKGICKLRIEKAMNAFEESDWKTIEALTFKNPRKEIIEYLGFSGDSDLVKDSTNATQPGELPSAQKTESEEAKPNRLSAFFDNPDVGNFLSNLEASQGAMTNNPFQLSSGSETEPQKQITRALLLGQFDQALDVSLREGNLSDAFMIAICGGEACIVKVQKAYFNQKTEGPSYLRLLASVVSKNLWDVVYNADLSGWKEVMAVLCTYAGAEEFSDLCEALGDRLEGENKASNTMTSVQKDASFCYLAGSRLEKVVTIWISDLDKHNDSTHINYSNKFDYSLYARSLQNFIEKVTVFREVTQFQDDDRLASSGWKLARLYDKYIEYADMVASHGQLHIAERYLALVPEKYPAGKVSRNRVKEALTRSFTSEALISTLHGQETRSHIGSVNGQQSQQKAAEVSIPGVLKTPSRGNPGDRHNPVTQPSDGPYHSRNLEDTAVQRSYQLQSKPHNEPQPNRGASQHPGNDLPHQGQESVSSLQKRDGPPAIFNPTQTASTGNWNDTPESFFRPPTSRRGTPGINVANSANSQTNPNLIQRPTSGFQPKPTNPLAPPPRNLAGPPPGLNSPSNLVSQAIQLPVRSNSATAGVYAPPQPNSNIESITQKVPVPRGPSPYGVLPTSLPSSNRYTPAPLSNLAVVPNQSETSAISGPNRQGPLPPNPFAPQKNIISQQNNSSEQYGATLGTPSTMDHSLVNIESSRDLLDLPPQSSRTSPAQAHQSKTTSSLPSRHPPGDRSHIPLNARIVYEVLSGDMQRVKAQAPQSFRAQVIDTEKRLNILFDHLNNQDLLQEDTIQDMVKLSKALRSRDFGLAQNIHVDLLTNKTDECGNWMVGVKRLIGMSKATP